MRDNLGCDCFVKENDTVWFASKDIDALFKANISTKVVNYIGSFNDTGKEMSRLYHTAVKHKNHIFYFPCEADDIAIYDIDTGKIEKKQLKLTPIDHEYWHLPAKTWFWKSVTVGNKAYIGGMGFRGLLVFDLESCQYEIIDKWVPDIENRVSDTCDEVYIEDLLVDGDYILCALCCIPAILRLNYKTFEYEIININVEQMGFSGIVKWRNQFVLIPRRNESLIIWESQHNISEKIKIPYVDGEDVNKKAPFGNYFLFEDKLFLFRAFNDKNYIINLEIKSVIETFEDRKISAIIPVDKENVLYSDVMKRSIHLCNLKTGKVEADFKMEWNEEEKINYLKRLYNIDDCNFESEDFDLGDFIKICSS